MSVEVNKQDKTDEITEISQPKKKNPKKETPIESEDILCKDLQGRFLLVRVGDRDRPANDAAIKEIEEKLVQLFKDNNINCVTFVTHHAVSIDVIA